MEVLAAKRLGPRVGFHHDGHAADRVDGFGPLPLSGTPWPRACRGLDRLAAGGSVDFLAYSCRGQRSVKADAKAYRLTIFLPVIGWASEDCACRCNQIAATTLARRSRT
jgi:hypothetical protein